MELGRSFWNNLLADYTCALTKLMGTAKYTPMCTYEQHESGVRELTFEATDILVHKHTFHSCVVCIHELAELVFADLCVLQRECQFLRARSDGELLSYAPILRDPPDNAM